MMDALQEAAREHFNQMTEDEFMAMANEIVHEVRAETHADKP